ncbi:MAG: ferrous iron transport protein B [Spirochaetales bacterium]|nr:ferrous iron transport protein B [Spirochaetales bacterium]MCF7938079.1 ferrous iron transport protein B [Spirochaetales bacterium]
MSEGIETKQRVIAVAGNPNSGKTTLFNGLSGGAERIGNWPGVTVEKKVGSFIMSEGSKCELVDLPGIYSLSASSEDERVARDYLLSGSADLVVNILDANNLERNLYLTVQLLELGQPIILAVNMMDLARKNNISIDLEALEKSLGVPVVGISAVENKDVKQLSARIERYLSQLESEATRERGPALKLAVPVRPVFVQYPNEIEDVVEDWIGKLKEFPVGLEGIERWIALKVLEQDPWITKQVTDGGFLDAREVQNALSRIESLLKQPADLVIADYRYGFVHAVVGRVIRRHTTRRSRTDMADTVVMNRVLGVPIFLGIMYAVFWITMHIGGAFIDFFDILFGGIFVEGAAILFENIGSPVWLKVLVADGVGAGIVTVSTFIPFVFMMFLVLSILEDSGYMARAAFVMDRFMRWLGLPGKSFVPLMVGFGCTVPAVLATKTLESNKDRIMTIFLSPLMSCSAKLPVYVLFAAAFFQRNSGGIIFSLYLAGIILAILTGLLLKHTLFPGDPSSFVMELPPYHSPRLRHVMRHTWIRLKEFLMRAGLIIIIAVSILGFLSSIGVPGGNQKDAAAETAVVDGVKTGVTESTQADVDADYSTGGASVLEQIGKGVSPVFRPMGVEEGNWPAAVALFTGIFAKEAIIGTLSGMYGQMLGEDGSALAEGDEEGVFRPGALFFRAVRSVSEALSGLGSSLADPVGAQAAGEEARRENTSLLKKGFTSPVQAYAYLLFVLIYFPCVASFAAILKESGPRYAWLQAGYLTLLGWIVAVVFYQLAEGGSVFWIGVALALTLGIILLFRFLGKRWNRAELT